MKWETIRMPLLWLQFCPSLNDCSVFEEVPPVMLHLLFHQVIMYVQP